jgi:hypothetical protein
MTTFLSLTGLSLSNQIKSIPTPYDAPRVTSRNIHWGASTDCRLGLVGRDGGVGNRKRTYSYIPLTLYPLWGSRGFSDIPP